MFSLMLISLLLVTTLSLGYEDPPTFRREPTTYYTGITGKNIKLFCQVTKTTYYKWYKDGVEISSRSKKYGIRQYSSLKIKNLTLNDQGDYTCKAWNDKGKVNKTMVLTVFSAADAPREGPPVFVKTMSRIVSKPVGGRGKLDCSAEGNPKPKITWKKDKKTLTRLDKKHQAPMNINQSSFVLTLTKLGLEDSGEYTCVVWNKFGNISFDFEVDVKERFIAKPRLPETMPNFTAMIGQNVSLECASLSGALQHYEWTRWTKVNGTLQSVKIDGRHPGQNKKYFLPTSQEQKEMSWHSSYLLVANVTMEDAGRYTCTVGTSLGKSEGDIYLTVLQPTTAPPSITYSKVKEKESFTVIYVIIGVFCTFIIFISALVYHYFKRSSICNKGENSAELTTTEELKPNPAFSSPYNSFGSAYLKRKGLNRKRLSSNVTQISLLSELAPVYDEEWELCRAHIAIRQCVGEGAFGQVMLAETYGLPGFSSTKNVAVKMLKPDASEGDYADFILELEVMKTIGRHKNIVNLIGACTQDGPLWVVVEYCSEGNLRDYLRSQRPQQEGYFGGETSKEDGSLTMLQLVSFAYQISKGMEYLSSNKCIHRDLAARNILIDKDLTAKIADFGLARDVHYHDYYRKTTDGLLPVKWMAIEALFDHVYTTQSDVWSFGVVLWEILTFGATPYPGIPVERLFELLKTGYRMDRPPNCSDEMYEIIEHCWENQPKKRPTFTQLVNQLDHMLSQLSDKEYLDLDLLIAAETPLASPVHSASINEEETIQNEQELNEIEITSNYSDGQEVNNIQKYLETNSNENKSSKNCRILGNLNERKFHEKISKDSGVEDDYQSENLEADKKRHTSLCESNISETSEGSCFSHGSLDSAFSNSDIWVPREHQKVCRTFSPTGKDCFDMWEDTTLWWQTHGYVSMISASNEYLKPDDEIVQVKVGKTSEV